MSANDLAEMGTLPKSGRPARSVSCRKHFGILRRRKKLSHSHHREIGALDPAGGRPCETGKSDESLARFAATSSAFEKGPRRPNLSHSHHREPLCR